jgi:hypothetical protein
MEGLGHPSHPCEKCLDEVAAPVGKVRLAAGGTARRGGVTAGSGERLNAGGPRGSASSESAGGRGEGAGAAVGVGTAAVRGTAGGSCSLGNGDNSLSVLSTFSVRSGLLVVVGSRRSGLGAL